MINILYIRAAIEANTGQRLPVEDVRDLLLEEGLITRSQYERDCFMGIDYSSLFEFDSADTNHQSLDMIAGLPA